MSSTDVLVATENGYGKRTVMEEYPVQKRGGQGVIAIQTSGRNGMLLVRLLYPMMMKLC